MNKENELKTKTMMHLIIDKIGLDGIDKDKVPFAFDSLELKLIKALEQEQIVMHKWEEVSCYDDFQRLELTKKGKVILFKDNNFDAVTVFEKILRSLRYDVSLLDDFLMTMDLEKNPFDILDVVKFELFCQIYDRSINSPRAL